MGTALLLGFPQKYIGGAKALIAKNAEKLSDWEFKYLPASGHSTEISKKDIEKIRTYADKNRGLHVIGFSDKKSRREVEDQVAPYFRFRWFNYILLRSLGSPDPSPFLLELVSVLVEELEWARWVKPISLNSPLLLPQCAFKPEKEHRDLWRHASAYGDLQNIAGAQKAVEAFRRSHHRRVILQNASKHKWVDTAECIFDDDGPRHGQAPYPRNWKYSFRIEDGFHFDVTHSSGRRFVIEDHGRTRHPAHPGAHVNIDPHGHVRG